MDLGDGDGVEEFLDDVEDAGETPWRVDDVQLAQPLGVVVLADSRGLLKVSVGTAHEAKADTLQVHDRAGGLEQVAGLARAGGQTGVGHLLVLDDKVGKHALIGGDLAHGFEVDLAELLDVEWSAVLVGLVVVLRVVLENLLLLRVIPVGNEVVQATIEGRAPLLGVNEPEVSPVSTVLPLVFVPSPLLLVISLTAPSPPHPCLPNHASSSFPPSPSPPIPSPTHPAIIKIRRLTSACSAQPETFSLSGTSRE